MMSGDDWISVKDRLPELQTPVLACNNDGMCADEREPFVGFLEDGIWYRSWDADDNDGVVTHWQPLPGDPV